MEGYFKQKQFINFLKNMSAQDSINEGFFSVQDGYCKTAAVDPKHLLLVTGDLPVCSKNIEVDFGINNIKSLINVISASPADEGKVPFEIKNNKLKISVKGGSVRFAILDKKEIATAAYVTDKTIDDIEKEMKTCIKILLPYEVIEKILYFCGLIENQMLTLKTIKDGSIVVGSDSNEKQSFMCKVGRAKNETIAPLSFDCKLFVSILKSVKEDKGNAEDFAPVYLYAGVKMPIVIEKDGFLWCLAHLSTEVNEEE